VIGVPERVDLGPRTAIRHEGSPERYAVLVPGMVYPTRAPVLWFAREAAMALGYSALEVLGEPVEHADKLGWERDCAERAIAGRPFRANGSRWPATASTAARQTRSYAERAGGSTQERERAHRGRHRRVTGPGLHSRHGGT
jgi:hypothetical protein